MEELTKQVKAEMIRTLVWAIIALGAGAGIYYFVW